MPLSRDAAFLFFRLGEQAHPAPKQKKPARLCLVGLVTLIGLLSATEIQQADYFVDQIVDL
jgi:hypothetical protein